MKLRQVAFTRFVWVVALVVGATSVALAQTTIRGTITDADTGEPLIGANVLVVGTSTGTITDFDGNYELTVPAGSDQIRVSYTGYSPQDIAIVAGVTDYSPTLSSGELLDEVVVVGYGTVKKTDLTGSIASVGERDFQAGIISNPEQLIQGRVAGVQITENSGEPGGGVNVRIRGTTSVRAGNGPLYVVDGVPLAGNETVRGNDGFGDGASAPRNPLSFINPSDIESISVLKDASAAAIYGARGANGVVIVTTKSGRGGNTGVDLNVSVGASSPANTLDLLEAGEYVAAAVAAGADPASADGGFATDWQDVIYRTGLTQNYSLGFGGGSANSNYRFSLSYLDQEGIVENTGLERFTGRISAYNSFLDELADVRVSLTASRINDEFAPITNNAGFQGSLIGAALQANPTLPIYEGGNADNGFLQSQDFRNPAAILEYFDDNARTNRVLANVTGGLNFTDNLRYQVTFGYDASTGVRRTSRDRRLFVGNGDAGAGVFDGVQAVGTTENRNVLLEHTLSFNTDLGDNPLGFVVGYAFQDFNNSFVGAQSIRSTLPNDEDTFSDPTFNLGAVEDPANIQAFSDGGSYDLQSYFGRANYTIADKYLLTATVRADGSSRFGENERYGIFPSFSAKWRLSEEDFIPESVYDLALRVGWGVTGNQEFPSNLSALAVTSYNNTGGNSLVSLPNPDLKWEETSQLNVGLDYGFAGGRILGSLDFFNKVTSDLLFIAQQPAPTPGSAFTYVNLDGEVINTGVELSLDGRIVDNADFSWQTILTGSYINNEVRGVNSIVNTGAINGQGLSGAYAQRIADGQPLFAYFLREFEGYDSEGLGIYANNGALAFVGDPLPDANVGLANNLRFGDVDVSLFLQGVFGFQVYNNTANAIFLKGNLRNGRNSTQDNADSPESPNNFGEASTRFLENGDFVRIQNLSIGYNIPTAGMNNVSRMRVYLTGQNLYTFTGYSGYDPEVNTDKSIDGVPSLGIDYTSYPRARTFLLGLNVGF